STSIASAASTGAGSTEREAVDIASVWHRGTVQEGAAHAAGDPLTSLWQLSRSSRKLAGGVWRRGCPLTARLELSRSGSVDRVFRPTSAKVHLRPSPDFPQQRNMNVGQGDGHETARRTARCRGSRRGVILITSSQR